MIRLLRALVPQSLYTVCCRAISRPRFDAVVAQARTADLLSDEHFTVDGTLLEAWAGLKSFRAKDEDPTPTKVGTIAAALGVHHDTVRAAIVNDSRGVRRGAYRPTALDPDLPFARDTLAQYPRLRATRLFERW